jgi:hypothetical protein
MSKRLTGNEEAVLMEMRSNAEYCINYAWLDGTNGMHRKELEPIIKHLKELEYIDFYRGLMTEEGEVAGSGWCRSRKGNDYMEEHEL